MHIPQSVRLVLLAFTMVLVTACAMPSAYTGGDTMPGMDHNATPDAAAMPGMESGDASMPADDTMADMEHNMDMMDQGVADLAMLTGNEFEIGFLDAMIPHHQSAVAMAKIAVERGQSAEVKAAAQAIIAAQETEINQMTVWLNDWYDRAPSGDDHGMSMTAEVDALRTVPAADFDTAFLRAMIPHHDSAIAMAELVPDRTTRPEMTALATAIIATQRAEIAVYEGWLAAWGG